MGKEKYLKDVLEFFEKTPVATTRDIKLIVKKRYAYLLIHNLIKSGKIERITKGFYTMQDDPTFSVFCFRPAYIGLQDALSIHNLWEQESNVVVITGKVVRGGLRKLLGSNVIVKRINPKYIFGYEIVKYGKFSIPVSDIEKTLIDFVYFKEKLDKAILKEIKDRLDLPKLTNYLKHYPKNFRKRVIKILKR